jgi:hypothetical protein
MRLFPGRETHRTKILRGFFGVLKLHRFRPLWGVSLERSWIRDTRHLDLHDNE